MSGFHGRRRISNDLLEHPQVLHVAVPTLFGNAANSLRSIALETLRDRDEAGFLQNLYVPAQIAIGEAAQLLQVAKAQSGRSRGQ